MAKEPLQIELNTDGLDDLLKMLREDTDTWTIHDGVEYGIWQETTSSGHPSLVPAFERVTKDLPKVLEQVIEGAAQNKSETINNALRKMAFEIQRLWAEDVNVDTGAYKNSITAEKE